MRIERLLILSALVALLGCGTKADSQKDAEMGKTGGARITFVELGSVNCIPCKAMQPIMKSIEEKYGDQIEVVFYDVWQADQKRYAQEYKIKLIPTQVFLDKDSDELMRHEGFLPEKEIDVFLQEQGLTPIDQ
jgi:thioredoxin 1